MLSYYRLEECVKAHIHRLHVPAVTLSVVSDQGILYANGFGTTSVEPGGAPVSAHTLFRIGSVTKPLLSTAVMRMVEMGMLELDRPLQEYDRELRLREPYTGQQLTLRMLLCHMSGLPADSFGDDTDPNALERYIREHLPLYQFVAPPGTLYSYANAGFILIGYIAQRVSGKRFPSLMREIVLDPLAMGRTTFDTQRVMTYPFALPHTLHNETLQVLHEMKTSQAYAPAGGAFSTVLDLANFLHMLLQHGSFHERPFLSAMSIQQMHTQQTARHSVNNTGYGLGFEMMQYRGENCIGHSGSHSTFGCQIILLPERKLAFALMVNRIAGMQRLVKPILDHLLGVPDAPSMIPQTVKAQQTCWPYYIGIYIGFRAGVAGVNMEGEQLVLTLNGQRILLSAHTGTVYFGYRPGSDVWVSVGFLFNESTPELVRYMMLDERPCERFDASASISNDLASWARFIGTYREPGGNHETITVHLEDQQLHLRLYDNTTDVIEGICLPIDETRFGWQRGLIAFTVAEDGTVPSLVAAGVYFFERVEQA